MKTLDLTSEQVNKKSTLFIDFSNTKRVQWNKYRRYGF